jgi:ribosome maturation factor RimP
MIFNTQLEANIFDKISGSLESMGYDIARIKVFKMTSRKVIQIMIERIDSNNLTLEDCEKASQYLSVLLDAENIISDQYNLEISSRGVDYPLTRSKDFNETIGKKVKILTKLPVSGRKRFSGVLLNFADEIAKIQVSENEIYDIHFANVADAHHDYFASTVAKNKNNKSKKRDK